MFDRVEYFEIKSSAEAWQRTTEAVKTRRKRWHEHRSSTVDLPLQRVHTLMCIFLSERLRGRVIRRDPPNLLDRKLHCFPQLLLSIELIVLIFHINESIFKS